VLLGQFILMILVVCVCVFGAYFLLVVLSSVVSSSAIDCVESLVCEMNCFVSCAVITLLSNSLSVCLSVCLRSHAVSHLQCDIMYRVDNVARVTCRMWRTLWTTTPSVDSSRHVTPHTRYISLSSFLCLF